MFLRAYRPVDKRQLQQLFYDTVHTVNARDYTPEQLDAWAPTEPRRESWARLDEQFCFVVEAQKVIVGFISMTDEGLVDFLFVHQHYQSKGIAGTLLKYVERLARKKGIPELHTEASVTARGFFEKKGFTMLAENRKVLGGAEFLNYRMGKRLEAAAAAQ